MSAPVPAPAAAAGYDTETLGGPMTPSTWIPDTMHGDGSPNVTYNSDGSVTIAGGGDTWNGQLGTAMPTWTGPGYTGEVFGGGFYTQATVTVPGATSGLSPWTGGTDGDQWPSFWANNGNNASDTLSIETDFMELEDATPGQYSGTVINWTTSPQTGYGQLLTAPAGDNLNSATYGFLWIPATATTDGSMTFYLNGQQVGQPITWTQANPGLYGIIDGTQMSLYIGAGANSPATFSNLQVWQASTADDSINGSPAPYIAPSNPNQTTTPKATSSPNGTTITAVGQMPIIDAEGNSWSLVQSATRGVQIAVNGLVDTPTGYVVALETLNGAMVQENSSGNWYSEKTNNDSWVQLPGNPNQTTTPKATSSPSGTTITAVGQTPIIDAEGNSWSLVQSAANGLQIAVNGTVDTPTANVVLLETLNGAMVQENTAGIWYSETTPNDSWVQVANPNPAPATVVTGTGSDTLVLSISEDAYANGDGTSDTNGDAAFTVSVDGKQLAGTFYATASHSAGASQNFTLKGDWAPGAHTVTVAFLNDAWGGTASTDRNLYVNDVTYDGTDTKQSATLMSTGSQTFSATDSTAIPPVVTGGGSDSLVVKVSEDYYLANAQLTVSVDGKQLGSTFTATTLHASGNSQTFAFAGDFGSGQHTVSVNFLNDAWAGTPATDRNLYVNDIVYNGTDTKQSAALMSAGAKTFSVSGGTTPSVSETGDHGSLQKNLSQTGTYAVGGDTFVLGNGNAATVTLGTGASQIKFVGPNSVTLTGGAGQATVTADAGKNKFVAGAGSLDVTGGAGKDAYVFHATSGLLTLEDFSLAKGDTLTIDKALQGSLHEASDGVGGTMLTFGTNTSRGVDIHGLTALPVSNILWA